MRYITLAQALAIAERVVGLPAQFASNAELCHLLDSALHSPQMTFSGVDLVPTIHEKAAVLCRHLCLNHPFPDGNKRMAWLLTVVFLEMNDFVMNDDVVRAICVMVEIASSKATQEEISWAFGNWVRPKELLTV